MKLIVCALFDIKTGAYHTPQFFVNQNVAVRALEVAVNNPDAGFLRTHPEDYVLHQLGTYDDNTGRFEQPNAPVVVASAASLKRVEIAVPSNDDKGVTQ